METQYITHALKSIEKDSLIHERADMVLRDLESEPLMSNLYATPQSPKYHAEGPVVRDHLRQILISLFAILEGKLQLLEIEEFARLKGYEAEIQEMENTIKENAATFEVFALLHDIGKQFRVKKGQDGEYHYHGHEKDIFRPDAQELLQRLKERYRLTDHDVMRLTEIISMHMVGLHSFKRIHNAKKLEKIINHANKRGIDADDFIDMLQAGVLLDQVFGSRKLRGGKMYTDARHLINFFKAEHDYAPWKIEEQRVLLERARRREEQKIFHQVGIDGDSIMKLTKMKPSKELGILLQKLQAAARRQVEMPELRDEHRAEITSRVNKARDKIKAL